MALTQPTNATASAANTSSQSQASTQALNSPPPQTFDILPTLHEILARIDHSGLDANDVEEEFIPTRYAELQSLDPKDLPNEVLPLKAKIRRAQREVEKLPDVERSVEEQREEIVELEERIRRQREMLSRIAELARGVQGAVGGMG